MRWLRPAVRCVVAVGSLLGAAACSSASGQPAAATAPKVTLFEGARLIVGDGSAAIERSAFVVQNNKITALGSSGEVQAPAGAVRVDLTGKTVMPAIVDTHGHIGYFDEVANKEMADDFSRARVLDHLDRFAFSGHALVYSMGSDAPNFIDARYSDDPKTFVDLRDESETDAFTGARYLTVGRGLAWPGTGNPRSTTFYPIVSPWLAQNAVRELASQKVKLVKLWSEDRWGFKDPKSNDPAYLTKALYAPAIAEAHRLGLRTVSHVKTLNDWKDTLRSGGDYITHTVEDLPVDDELLAMIKARGNFANVAALTTELQGGSAPRGAGPGDLSG